MKNRPWVLWEDDWIVIVNKPSGIAVHKGWDASPYVMMKWVRNAMGRWVYPVHRLDRPTSGVLVFAFSSDMARVLQEQFQARTITKRYIALVRGILKNGDCLIDHAVPKRPKGERVTAQTEITQLWSWPRYSIVAAEPITGRLHQIRRHLKHLSHPLIGDVRYGKGDHNRKFREEYNLHRLGLHALEMVLIHPHSQEQLHIVAPPPPDLSLPFDLMGVPSWVWEPRLGEAGKKYRSLRLERKSET